jgi:RNA exonuclease 1
MVGSDATMKRRAAMMGSSSLVSGQDSLAGAGATRLARAHSFTTSAHLESPGHAPTRVPSGSVASNPSHMGSRRVTAGQPSKPSPSLSASTIKDSPSHGPAKPPQKKESLNPRMLRSAAPAQHAVRLKLLKLLHNEFQRLNTEHKSHAKNNQHLLSDQQLITHALDVEERLATEKGILYTSATKHHIMKYKRIPIDDWIAEREEQHKLAEKQRSTMTAKPVRRPVLGPPKVIDTGLTPAQEIRLLKMLDSPSIAGLSQFGYIPVAPSAEAVAKAQDGVSLAGGWENCDRCQQRFQVFPGRRQEDGELTSGGRCKHHPGRRYYPERTPGTVGGSSDRRWSCCSTTLGDSPGCAETSHHVFKVTDPARLAAIMPFEETPENTVPDDRAVAFDCEMGYTVHGLELIRLTATAWPTNETLLDVLVRPKGEILDLNSVHSGVWPQDMTNAVLWTGPGVPPLGTSSPTPSEPMTTNDTNDDTTTAAAALNSTRPQMKMVDSPARARELLFSLISPTTPLIGHALENDLNATRIIHPTIVDSVLLYPHPAGLPLRYGLRALVERNLNRIIQANTGQGHDSAEDARAAGDLVRLKVGEKWKIMQLEGWKFDDNGELVKKTNGALTEAFIEGKQHVTMDRVDSYRARASAYLKSLSQVVFGDSPPRSK